MNQADENERANEMERRLRQIEIALFGGDVQGHPGVMQTLTRVMVDMYDQAKGFGVQSRVERLERDKLIYESRAQGAFWMARMLWAVGGGGLSYIIVKVFHL